MSTSTSKTELRTLYAEKRSSLSADWRAEATREICRRLMNTSVWQKASAVCSYASIRGEMDLLPLWSAAMTQGKHYALPATVTGAREGRMEFRCLSACDPTVLVPARYGIPEPPATCPVLSPADMRGALILVPALAFDTAGYRIGYGGGYYDRYLAALKDRGISFTAVGLCFSICRAETLPHEQHDMPVDIIIDERRVTYLHGHTE